MRGTQPGWEDDTPTPGDAPPLGDAPAPPEPPRPPALDEGAIAKVTKSGRTALWLGAAALLLSLFVAYLGVVAGIAAVIMGLRAQAAGRRIPMRVPGAVPGVVMGIVGSVLSLLMLVALLYMWGDWQSYNDCKSKANTISDQTACKDALARAFERKFGLPKGSFRIPF
jgi:hypothetical protein